NPGFSFSAGEEVDGYFPYAEMSQEGGSSRIANGNFEFSFGDSAEPIGWIPVDYDRSDNDSYAPIEWFNHKFKIERDFNISPEGSGYLRLNTFYEAVSEEIDVEPNFEYVLTGKINTQFLDQSGNQALSAILIQPIDSFGGSISSGFNDCILQAGTLDGDWYLCRNLDVAAGLPWQDVSYRFNSGSASKLKIKLSNIGANDPGCTGVGRYNLDQGCGLSGYGLFDNISLKAVLGVNSEDGQNNFISRSCRLYPTADALSCDFQRDESFFFGKQGFCVTADPADPKKCVQWWPVDQILGETLDEVVAGYSDRAPLYYCIGSDALLFEVAESDVTFNIASDHRQYVGNSLLTNDGTGVNFEPFDLDDDYQALFRAPYIKSFDFSAFGLGVGGDLDG
ncbi:hypothetical protein HYZ76_02185, partial [Candidatus Falkowbacteria bacterium]|nr:hypothetical protein [Candidatus Falkowbacteria bacterium]